MQEPNKLPLVQRSLRLLVEQLTDTDRVALVVYAGASGLVLPSTLAAERRTILDAIERLQAGGSTNGAAGIELAYDVAAANFIRDGINRVVLATDGDFNVGITNRGALERLIHDEAARGIFLTALGFGYGNLKDATLEQLADRGNGIYAYIDTLQEARRVFVEQATSTLLTIAKDVKIQVEFNPACVQAYRLIGYENRILAAEDFNNDLVDAGDIGAGHTITALYEIIPTGVAWQARSTIDPLKYRTPEAGGAGAAPAEYGDELLTVKIRHKEPTGSTSELASYSLPVGDAIFAQASTDFRFAVAVAGFGMLLRDSPFRGSVTWQDVATWAESGQRTNDRYRGEFLDLVRRAKGVVQGYASTAAPAAP
jgi:Ca-activated chloride channel family protein